MNAQTKTRLVGLAVAAAAVMCVAGPAQALSDYGDVTAKFDGRPVAGTGDASTGGVFQFTRAVGGLNNDFGDSLLTNNPVNQFIGMCIERGENISQGNTYYWTVRDLADAPIATPGAMGSTKATDVAKLVTLALGGNLANLLTVGEPTVTAMQIALWEITTETLGGAYNLGTGTWQAANATAAGWLATLNDNTNTVVGASRLFALTRAGVQDQLVQVVPIPAAAWLLGSGLLGLFGLARRKKAAATA